FQNTLKNDMESVANQLGDTVRELTYKFDARHKIAHYTEYDVTDLDSLRAAIEVLPTDTVLTLPEDMVFEVGDSEFVIDRPIALRGGVFHGTGHVIRIASDDVQLEDM